jgi:hypothetical protein
MTPRLTCTVEQLLKLYAEWASESWHTSERFGQAVCNRYLPEGQAYPELFYENNHAKAFGLAYMNTVT